MLHSLDAAEYSSGGAMIRSIGLLLCTVLCLSANTVTLDFEGFPDSTILSTQYPGVTFSNAVILTAGVSLNEFELPPRFGTNVVSDNGGPMFISFATPVLSFSGYFTYAEPLIIQAFDAGSNQVAAAASAFSNNMALSGNPGSSPNEFIQMSFAGGISGVKIAGDPAGGSFVLDDMTYSTGAVSGVPEPSSGSLCFLCCGAVALLLVRRRLRCFRGVGFRSLLLSLTSTTIFPLFGQPQQHTIGGTSISPTMASAGKAALVTAYVSISDSTVIPGGVNLLRLDAQGNATVIGTFHDDGQGGDMIARDGIYTVQVTLNEPNVGTVHLQVTAAFRGSLTRVRADLPSISVQVTNAPDIAVAEVANDLISGNVTAALQRFLIPDTASVVLTSLSSTGLQRLGNAFAAAQQVRSIGDLHVYSAPWTSGGITRNVEFSVGPDATGRWVIVGW